MKLSAIGWRSFFFQLNGLNEESWVLVVLNVWMTGNHGSVGVGDLGISLLNWAVFELVTGRR